MLRCSTWTRLRAALSLSVLGLVLGLAACDASPPGSKGILHSTPKSKTVGAQLTGYNHTDKSIGGFYVNGQWGGNITPGSGGGKFVCCVSLPDPWQLGMTVKVEWEDHDLKEQERIVEVPKYDSERVAQMNVHFLRSGEIKVFAGRGGLLHKDYPLRGPEAQLKPGVPLDIRY